MSGVTGPDPGPAPGGHRPAAAAVGRRADHHHGHPHGAGHAVVPAELSAEDRSWIGLIVQAGINAFVDVVPRAGRGPRPSPRGGLRRGSPGVDRVCRLQQTVEMVRLTIEVVEENVAEAVGADDAPVGPRRDRALRPRGRVRHRGGLRPGRRAARAPGTPASRRWSSTRVLRGEADETVRSRASALGWGPRAPSSSCSVGRRSARRPDGPASRSSTTCALGARTSDWTRCAPCRATGWSSSSAASTTPDKAGARGGGPLRRTGPVVVGPVVPDLVARQHLGPRRDGGSARRAGLAGGTAAGHQRRPAPRAGALPATGTPAGSSSQEVYRPLPRRRSRDAGDGGVLPRPAAARSRRPRGRSSCTPTPCATGCAGRRDDRAHAQRPARGLHLRVALTLGART